MDTQIDRKAQQERFRRKVYTILGAVTIFYVGVVFFSVWRDPFHNALMISSLIWVLPVWLCVSIAAEIFFDIYQFRKYQPLIYKTIAVILAWLAWLVPLGLHRVMMRRRYAWLHPVAFLSATLASNQFFFHTPENAEVGRLFVEQGIAPHFGQFADVWLFSFTIAWMLLVIYDAIMIFSWSVNDSYEPDKLGVEARRMASSGGVAQRTS